MNHPDQSLRSTRAFTLIELLVVVAIIAILLSILLPSAFQARERGRRILCASKVHVTGTAILNFANDNDGDLPSGKRDNGYEHCIWVSTKFYNIITQQDVARKPNSYAQGENPSELARCPTMPDNFGFFRRPIGWVIGYNYLGAHEAAARAGKWTTANSITDKPDIPIYADLNNWSPRDGWTFIAHGPRGFGFVRRTPIEPPKAGSVGGNVLRLDGSCEWKDISRMKTYATGQGRNYPCMW